MSTCRSCGAEIIWAETPAGKRMPVDVVPNERGNLQLQRVDSTGTRVQLIDHSNEDCGHLHYMSHFVTCPQSTKWRKEAS